MAKRDGRKVMGGMNGLSNTSRIDLKFWKANGLTQEVIVVAEIGQS